MCEPPTSRDRFSRIAVPTDNPQDPNFIVPTGSEFDGVVAIGSGDTIHCTGSLLITGRHILTAAHCLNFDRDSPNLRPHPNNYTVYFDLPAGRVSARLAILWFIPSGPTMKALTTILLLLN